MHLLIAGIKISNLFIIDNSSIQDALYAFKKYKLSYYFLLRTAKKTTFLLYDRDGLENYLRDESVSELLGQMGYGSNGLMDSLRLFRTRYRQYASENKGFPHELDCSSAIRRKMLPDSSRMPARMQSIPDIGRYMPTFLPS